MQMDGGFRMNGDIVASGRCERLDMAFRTIDHQMCIERQRATGPDISDEFRSECDIRHELAVHDIEMNPVCSRILDRRDFIRDMGEIRGENRRGNDEFALRVGSGCFDMRFKQILIHTFHDSVIAVNKVFCKSKLIEEPWRSASSCSSHTGKRIIVNRCGTVEPIVRARTAQMSTDAIRHCQSEHVVLLYV
jgi:hypothetical protein